MSTDVSSYSPLRYHQGTVWPHDTAVCAEGMRRYGFREEASHVAISMIHAAVRFRHRLPECFAGLPRDKTEVIVQYPGALRPQAWAAAAPLSCLRTFLGLDVVNGKLRVRRSVPERIGRLELKGVHMRGKRVDV